MFIAFRRFRQHRQIVNTPTLERFVKFVCWLQRQHTRFFLQLFTMHTLFNYMHTIVNHIRPIKHTTNHVIQLHTTNMSARRVHFIQCRPPVAHAQYFSQITAIHFEQLVTNQLKLLRNTHQGCILIITKLLNQ